MLHGWTGEVADYKGAEVPVIPTPNDALEWSYYDRIYMLLIDDNGVSIRTRNKWNGKWSESHCLRRIDGRVHACGLWNDEITKMINRFADERDGFWDATEGREKNVAT